VPEDISPAQTVWGLLRPPCVAFLRPLAVSPIRPLSHLSRYRDLHFLSFTASSRHSRPSMWTGILRYGSCSLRETAPGSGVRYGVSSTRSYPKKQLGAQGRGGRTRSPFAAMQPPNIFRRRSLEPIGKHRRATGGDPAASRRPAADESPGRGNL
jgi:hypothetical protein